MQTGALVRAQFRHCCCSFFGAAELTGVLEECWKRRPSVWLSATSLLIEVALKSSILGF